MLVSINKKRLTKCSYRHVSFQRKIIFITISEIVVHHAEAPLPSNQRFFFLPPPLALFSLSLSLSLPLPCFLLSLSLPPPCSLLSLSLALFSPSPLLSSLPSPCSLLSPPLDLYADVSRSCRCCGGSSNRVCQETQETPLL